MCYCNENFDIRRRCMPTNDSWDMCPMKINTIEWLIENNDPNLEHIEVEFDGIAEHFRISKPRMRCIINNMRSNSDGESIPWS